MTEIRFADSMIGALVDGRYRVRDRVARGGMASVYIATDERLERTVAVKMIHPTQATDSRFVERFVAEARAIARLTHPNVVAAYDQGSHAGLPYVIMEYVPGRTLREVLSSRRRLTPVEALAITEQMLAGVAAAHRAGLVHRDIKPENVLVAEAPSGGPGNLVDSVVKVTDFGLAQAVAASTMAGQGGEPLLATAAYVSPELVRDGHADPRSDVYSAGVVLFELLTGRVPFDQGEPAAVAWQQVDQDIPPPSAYVSGLPPRLDALVVRATRRDPTARPTDGGALLSEIQSIREELATASPPSRSADATMVISTVPATGERPAWARLPSSRAAARTVPLRRTGQPVPPAPADPGGQLAGRPAAGYQRPLLIGLAVALGLLLVISGWWFGFGRFTSAPDLVGLSEADAVARAERQGLVVEQAAPQHNDQVPLGHVISQDPAGRVARNGDITITLSLGPEQVPVPDVIGADVAVASRQLESVGLVVVEGQPEYSNTVPAGRVLAVDPPAGEPVVPGAQVTVTLSQGRPPIDIPFVVGKNVNQATQELQQLNLQVTTETVESDRPQGEVVDQDPGGGNGAEPGAVIRLEVSAGPPTQPLPNVVGQRCAEGAQSLDSAGFQVTFGLGENGRVLLQNPSAGTGLPPGATVEIFCS